MSALIPRRASSAAVPGPIAATSTPARLRASPPTASIASSSSAAPFGLVTQTTANEPISRAACATSPLTARGWMRMAGVSTTSAPSCASRRASPLACARARVTAIVRPCSGRLSSHAISSPSFATGPTRVMAGGLTPSAATRAAISASVDTTACCPGSVPRSITAAGMSAGRPASIRRLEISGSCFTPM
jgi:hypothetical protein